MAKEITELMVAGYTEKLLRLVVTKAVYAEFEDLYLATFKQLPTSLARSYYEDLVPSDDESYDSYEDSYEESYGDE